MNKTFFAAFAVFALIVVSAGAQAKVDVSGKWAFNVETSAGSGTPSMTFKQDGEKLTGKYSGQLGEADITGTVKGAAVAFTFNVDAGGQMINFKYDGTVDNDTMKGKVSAAGLGDGTFTAKRQ
jgi:hypothetical protein